MPITTTQLSKINLSSQTPSPFRERAGVRVPLPVGNNSLTPTNRQTALSEQRPNLLPKAGEKITLPGKHKTGLRSLSVPTASLNPVPKGKPQNVSNATRAVKERSPRKSGKPKIFRRLDFRRGWAKPLNSVRHPAGCREHCIRQPISIISVAARPASAKKTKLQASFAHSPTVSVRRISYQGRKPIRHEKAADFPPELVEVYAGKRSKPDTEQSACS
jgi:hypothetical protein